MNLCVSYFGQYLTDMATDGNILVMATHGIILVTAVIGMVSSLLNRKKLNKIEIEINGRLADKITAAIKEARDSP
jgi:hypothetical protein